MPIEYNNKAPIEIEITETNVPIIFPNNIPDSNKSGDPNPKRIIHITEKIKKMLDETHKLEISIKSNALIKKNILLKKIIVDLCFAANS